MLETLQIPIWLVGCHEIGGFFWALVESCYAHWKLEIDTQNDGLEEVPPTDYRYLGYPVSILNFSGVYAYLSQYIHCTTKRAI